MKLLRSPFIAILIATLMHMTPANAAGDFPDSPLLPGTKVVAGDLSKDEFFIVAENDVVKVKKPVVETIGQDVTKPHASITIALNKALKTVTRKSPIPDARSAPRLIDMAFNKFQAPKAKAPLKDVSDSHERSLFMNVALNKAIESKALQPIHAMTKAKVQTPQPMHVAFKKAVSHEVSAQDKIEGTFKKSVAQNGPIARDFEFDDDPFLLKAESNVQASKPVIHKLPIKPAVKKASVLQAKPSTHVALMKPVMHKVSKSINVVSNELGERKPEGTLNVALNQTDVVPVTSKKTVYKLKSALHQVRKSKVSKTSIVQTTTTQKHSLKLANKKVFKPKIISYVPSKPVVKTYAKTVKTKQHREATQALTEIHQFVIDKQTANTDMDMALR